MVLTESLTAVSLNIGENTFLVDSDKVIIGTSNSTGVFSIYKDIDENQSQDISMQELFIHVDGTGGNSAIIYYLDQNITFMDFDLNFNSGTVLQDSVVKGIDLNLTDVNLLGSSEVYGLYVDVSSSDTDSDSASRYAAVFTGGTVGIGLVTPNELYALDVSGDVLVDSITLTDGFTFDQVTLNSLIVSDSAELGTVSVNSLEVLGDMVISNIEYLGDFSVADASFSTLNVSGTSTLVDRGN